jgi:hypothetical protein
MAGRLGLGYKVGVLSAGDTTVKRALVACFIDSYSI